MPKPKIPPPPDLGRFAVVVALVGVSVLASVVAALYVYWTGGLP